MPVSSVRIAAILLALLAWPGAARPAEPNWPENLIIGTALAGGTYDIYGAGVASVLNRQLKLTVSTRATEGPIENMKLLEAGEVQLAFVTLGLAQQRREFERFQHYAPPKDYWLSAFFV